MVLKIPTRRPRLPVMLQQRSTDEYTPRPYSALDHRIIAQVRAQGPDNAARLSMSLGDYWAGRQGTAAALRAVDNAWGGGFYKVPKESELDRAAADDALGGNQLVIDVQGHYISARPATAGWNEALLGLAESVAGDRFQGLGKLVAKQAEAGFSFVEFLRCIFLESETAVVVLTSAPGDELRDPKRMLNNSEMIGTRELIDRFAGSSRLINHCVVHPNIDGDLDLMDKWSEWCNPAGWKVYTLYADDGKGPMHWGERPYRLDDEKSGVPFLERVVDTGSLMVCAHKGISAGADVGWDGPSSPRDIGPAAAGFPTVNFIIYHSGYEPREGDQEEGPYSEEVSNTGTNRLVKSLKNAGIKTGLKRLRRAGHNMVPYDGSPARGGPRPGQASSSGWRGQCGLGHGLHMVRPSPASDRRLPCFPHSGGVQRTLRLSPVDSGNQGENPGIERCAPLWHRSGAGPRHSAQRQPGLGESGNGGVLG